MARGQPINVEVFVTAEVGAGLPDMTATAAALEVSTQYSSPALLNHSVRSYLWGRAYAAANGIDFDAELLGVAALLHDIGLTEVFDSHTVAFEDAGGQLSWVFGAAAGWPVARRDRVAEIIVLHMRDMVSASADPESHLLQVATSFDVSGRYAEHFPQELRSDVLARYPRLGFGAAFLDLCTQQANRKPGSAAAELIRAGLAARIAANPLDR
jgi:hypothetical protein